MPHSILITIDVEDWFQVENFKPWIPYTTWTEKQLRVEKNVHALLDLFDDAKSRHPRVESTTFFVLGWIAKRLPHLVREIHCRGHEVASHGMNHQLPTQMPPEALYDDLVRSRELLENLIAAPVTGYRAPSFAVSDAILEHIRRAGYRYDSSYNSFGLHGRYGRISLPPAPHTNDGRTNIKNGFAELPVSNLRAGGCVLPWAGGGYFRLMPTGLFIEGARRVLKKTGAYVFYMHPWEIDPHQPRVNAAGRWFRFRHYVHLQRTGVKLRRLIDAFGHCRFTNCHNYLFTSP